jgi:hypothetical protein
VGNLQTLGFETLVGRLNVPEAPLEAYVKVASPSRVALWNFHGDHTDGSLSVLNDLFSGGSSFMPTDLESTYSGNLDTLVLAACDVLDINDYNNFRYRQVLTASGEMGWLPQAARENAGLKWYQELIVDGGSGRPTGRPGQVLLGYNGPAPVWAVANVMEEYGRQLQVFQGATNAQQMAWMTANLIVGQNPAFGTPESPSSLAMQACAIDEERYYYIPFEYKRKEGTDEWRPPDLETVQGIYWVERSRWSETPEDWDRNVTPAGDEGLGLAQKASIL